MQLVYLGCWLVVGDELAGDRGLAGGRHPGGDRAPGARLPEAARQRGVQVSVRHERGHRERL